MATLTLLWLPILVSAVALFIASNVLWMALPFWHRSDYGRLPDDKPIMGALKAAKSGQYIVPWMDWKTMTPEQRAEVQSQPAAFMLVRNPGKFSFGKSLSLYFLYMLVVAYFVAWLMGRTNATGATFLDVFPVAGVVGFIAFGFHGVSDSIWYGKPWTVTFKEIVDGLIYGLLIGATFGWLWPR